MNLVLASLSPRRRTLLEQIGVKPVIVPSHVDESSLVKGITDPGEVVVTLARSKVSQVCANYRDQVVLGADTIVYLESRILGKPRDEKEAQFMLRQISGKTHSVYTGVALYNPKSGEILTDYDCTRVTMREMDQEEIEWYVSTGEPMDKAGSYALQGIGGVFVEKIEGDWTSVVGLPLPMVYRMLKTAGFGLREFSS